MCLLCEQAYGHEFRVHERRNGRSLHGLSIAPSELLDEGSLGVTQRSTNTDGVLDYYLHAVGGAVTISGGGFGEQTIQSVTISRADQAFFNEIVRQLDGIIDLDFDQVGSAAAADVDIYYDTEIDVGTDNTLGLATTSGAGWELFVNFPKVVSDDAYRHYVLLHEFGHALGLEHPFDARDGDALNGITDPWQSAHPEDTVMAYRDPSSGTWPDFFTHNDINALISAWGAERQFLADGGSRFNGNAFTDDVQGGDGADHISAFDGFDVIAGGAGDDELRGGRNADEVRGGSGSDQLFGGRGHDTLIGGKGDDVLRGGFGADLFVYSAGNDLIEDFHFSENDRLELQHVGSYEFQQHNQDLKVITSLGTITLAGVDQDQLLSDGLIINA